jgi:NAD+ kinase
MHSIKTVGIIAKPNVERAAALVPPLIRWLAERGIETRCDDASALYAGKDAGLARDVVAEGCDLIIVLGGDGTLLSAAHALHGREIPLFPVNLGGLGFLTAITVEEIYPELERAFRGEHRIGKRRMLFCELMRGDAKVAEYEALNDVVLTKAAIARVVDLHTHVDGRFVCAYKADGLIISTPTGSTAYSLSAGGPIIFPSVGALCITPICPHMLTNRPVIVPDTSVISVACRGVDGGTFLTIDGQIGEPLAFNDRVVCRSSPHTVNLVRPPKKHFFDVLREKLKWGER